MWTKYYLRESEFLFKYRFLTLHFNKIRAKKFHAAKPLAFLLHFLLQRDQKHYSNLISKIMKMCEQILKKDSAPILFKLFEL